MENLDSLEKDNFEKLVENLTSDERSGMLSQLKGEGGEEGGTQSGPKSAATKTAILEEKLKKESFITRLVVWLKSVIYGVSTENVYNASLVTDVAREINAKFRNLIDIDRKMFTSGFYTELSDLKHVYDFFKPIFDNAEKKPHVFYFLLGCAVIPDIMSNIKTNCDVYSYSFTKMLPSTTKKNLQAKAESILSSISPSKRAEMKARATEFEKLRAFSKMPLDKILSSFSDGDGGKSCPFSELSPTYDQFSKALDSPLFCADVTWRTLFSIALNVSDLWDYEFNSEENIASQISYSQDLLSSVNLFIDKVPIKILGKLVYDDSLYESVAPDFGAGWFEKLRNAWHAVLDYRWEKWNSDFQKSEVIKKLEASYGIKEFPKFPYRPWEGTQEDGKFKSELSLGFINYFVKEIYPKYEKWVKVCSMEGTFSIKDNRTEFDQLVSQLDLIIGKNDSLAAACSSPGEFGEQFAKIGASDNPADRERLKIIIRTIQGSADEIVSLFLKFIKAFENILSTMLGEKTTLRYGPLSNLYEIHGKDNKTFYASMKKLLKYVRTATEVMPTIVDIDRVS